MRASVLARPSLALAWLTPLAALAALAAPALAGPDGAPDPQGFYATLGIGASWPQSSTVRDTAPGLPVSTTVLYDGSLAAEAGLGYDFGAVRTELSAVYNRASITGASGGNTATGNRNATSIFASAFLDIPTRSRWVPYLGGGLGYTNLSSGTVTASSGGLSQSLNTGSQGLFGYQAKAGVAYIASDSTDVYLEGIYQGAPGYTAGCTSYGPYNSWGAGWASACASVPKPRPGGWPKRRPRRQRRRPGPSPQPFPPPRSIRSAASGEWRRSNRALAELARLSAPPGGREARWVELALPPEQVHLGDQLRLEEGDRVAAVAAGLGAAQSLGPALQCRVGRGQGQRSDRLGASEQQERTITAVIVPVLTRVGVNRPVAVDGTFAWCTLGMRTAAFCNSPSVSLPMASLRLLPTRLLRVLPYGATFAAGVLLTAGIASAQQPNMQNALSALYSAQASLQAAAPNKGGHRDIALSLVAQAIQQVQLGIAYAAGL